MTNITTLAYKIGEGRISTRSDGKRMIKLQKATNHSSN